MKRNILIIGLAALLSACGFQLRGTETGGFALHELGVSGRNAYGENVKLVTQALEQRGVKVSNNAPYKLVLATEQLDRRGASYTGGARVAEYELTMQLGYEIVGQGNLPLLSSSIDVQSYYQQDSNNLVGSSQEEQSLIAQLRREAVAQLVSRLGQLTPATLEQLQLTAEQRAEAQAQAEQAAREYRATQTAPQQSPIELPQP